MTKKQIKVMVVDDSALVRKVLTEVLSSDNEIKVIAQANDPIFAMKKMQQEMPDVITLDVEMPRMDGITFLKKIMHENPIPVVMCSSLTSDNAGTTVEAIKAGAVDIITKPKVGVKGFINDSAIQIIDAVKAAAQAKVTKRSNKPLTVKEKNNADIILAKVPRSVSSAMAETTQKIIAMGASTGGTQALRDVLAAMPSISPGVVIVQHMPEKFTSSFAQHLNELSPMEVREAQHGDKVLPGLVLLAPGGKHMILKRSGAVYHVDILDGPLVSRHRPSVDVMFRSVARYAGSNAVACLMTGMGDDGAEGLKEILEAGGCTFAQDEQSCVVFGMPKEAWKRGAAQKLVPLKNIPQTLLNAIG